MLELYLGMAASVVTCVLGAGLGWLIHGHISGAQLEIELAASKNLKVKDNANRQSVENVQTAELMAKLAELTTEVAAEVGKHSGNIEAINVELASVKDGDAGAVVAAVKKILQVNQRMQVELHNAETRLQDQQQELIAQTTAARTDQLTLLANRRALDEELRKCVLEYQRSTQPFCVMVLDVDHFKKFNDTHGHLAGDEALKIVAHTITSQARPSELVARYGGEEIVVVFRGETIAACRDRADQIRASIGECTVQFEGKELRVAASAGVAEIGLGEDERVLIRRADEALYISKKAGRNCAHWNDGRQNLPITPGLLAKTEAAFPRPRPAETDSNGHNRFELYDIRFSDVSFSPNLDRRVAEWKRTGHTFSLAVCAIDHADQLRDLHGDEMLQKIITATTTVVTGALRDMDQVAAFGDCGFAISLPTARLQFAIQAAERVRKAVERLYVPTGFLPQFTVSVGVAEIIEGNDSSRLFERAQNALEAAQTDSVNCTFVHDGLKVASANTAVRQPAMA